MRYVTALVLAATLFGAMPARAQDASDTEHPEPDAAPMQIDLEAEGAQERARLHFQAGASYYEAGAYEDALREWQHAYELSGRPEMLYNLSLAYQGSNQLAEARDHLRRFLAEVEAIPGRVNFELRLERLADRVAQREREEAARAEEAEASAARAAALREAEAQPAPSDDAYVSPGAVAGFVAAGAGALTFAIFGGLAAAENGRLQTACATPCGLGAADDLRALALVSDVGLGVTFAGAVVGLIFVLVDTGPSDPSDASVVPSIDPWGGGALVRGRF